MKYAELTDDERRVLRRARRAWRGALRIETLEHAALNLSLDPTWPFRRRLYQYISTRPQYLMRLRMFGATPAWVTLTDEEKLAGRFLLHQGTASTTRLAKALAISRARALERLAALTEAGFAERTRRGWRLAPGCERFTEGLGLNFHTVVLEDGRRFGVP